MATFVPEADRHRRLAAWRGRRQESRGGASLTRRSGALSHSGEPLQELVTLREEQPAVLHIEEVGFFIRVMRQFCSVPAMVDKLVAFANFLTEGLHGRTRQSDHAGRDL